jgi:hypothetical protein
MFKSEHQEHPPPERRSPPSKAGLLSSENEVRIQNKECRI